MDTDCISERQNAVTLTVRWSQEHYIVYAWMGLNDILEMPVIFYANSLIRVQGACLCHIKPAYLLDMQEFKHWCSLQVQIHMHTSLCARPTSCKWNCMSYMLTCAFFLVIWGWTWCRLQQCWLRVSQQTILDWCAAANTQGEKCFLLLPKSCKPSISSC